jgi:Flp pilus assembly protein TadG
MLRGQRSSPVSNRRGSALAVTAVCMVLIAGVMAVVLDGGMLMAQRRRAQAVADAAALAAAYNLYNNYAQNQGADTGGAAAKEAQAIASGNGYTNDGTTSTVTVNIPPTSGTFKSKASYAEVIVQHNQPRYFSALWGSGTMTVTARTVSRGISNSSGPGILLLDPNMKASLNVTGAGGVSVTGGSIVVDSSHPQAGVITSSGSVTAPNINFYGGDSTSGSGQFVGTVKTGVARTADPLSTLAVPDKTTMTVRSSSQYQISSSGTYTLQPGVYTGGIKISAPGPGSVTLQSGIYYMDGGGFQLSGSINLSGSGVMIYNAPQHSSEQVSLSGTGSVTLTPPTSGTYKGISVFQDRSSSAAIAVTGNGGMNISGTIYGAGAEVDLTGNGGTNVVGAQIIANNMKVTGNGSVSVNHGAGSGPARDTRIVE